MNSAIGSADAAGEERLQAGAIAERVDVVGTDRAVKLPQGRRRVRRDVELVAHIRGWGALEWTVLDEAYERNDGALANAIGLVAE